jgi:hypothetical protein
VLTRAGQQKYPIVPLYGDMQFSLEQTIKRCPHYDEKAWGPGLEDKKLALEYEIQDQIDSIRTEYNMYLAKFTGMIHQVLLLLSLPPQSRMTGCDEPLLLLVRTLMTILTTKI